MLMTPQEMMDRVRNNPTTSENYPRCTMETGRMIKELQRLEITNQGKPVHNFGTRWSDVCRDTANTLLDMTDEIDTLKRYIEELEATNKVQKDTIEIQKETIRILEKESQRSVDDGK